MMLVDVAELIVSTIDQSAALTGALGHSASVPKRFRDRADEGTEFPFLVFLNSASREEFTSSNTFVLHQWWDFHVYSDNDEEAFQIDRRVLSVFKLLAPIDLSIGKFQAAIPTSNRSRVMDVDGPYGTTHVTHMMRSVKFLVSCRMDDEV